MIDRPEFDLGLTPRARQIVEEARLMLEEVGWEAVSMRLLADRVGMRAPSLYKHFADRSTIETALVAGGLMQIGEILHAVVEDGGSTSELLAAYRACGADNPNLYRLTTSGRLDRQNLPVGLEDWAGSPFYLVTGDEYVAQALWSFAHGTMILELDGRYPPESRLDLTWEVGAARFAGG